MDEVLQYLKSASASDMLAGIGLGFLVWFVVRYGLLGFYTVDQNERAVKTQLRPRRAAPGATTLDDPIARRAARRARRSATPTRRCA